MRGQRSRNGEIDKEEEEERERKKGEKKGSFVPRDYNAVTVKMLK